MENENETQNVESTEDLFAGSSELGDESALDTTAQNNPRDAGQDEEGAEAEAEATSGTEQAPIIFNIDDDAEDAQIRGLMKLDEDNPEEKKEIDKICRNIQSRHAPYFSARWPMSLSSVKGLARVYSARYQLEYFAYEQAGHLQTRIHAMVKPYDEVHPDTILGKFGDMLDQRTLGYIRGEMPDMNGDKLLPIVDQDGNPLRMKCFYLKHTLLDLGPGQFPPPYFRSRGLRSGPYDGNFVLEMHHMLEAKRNPGERVLGATWPFHKKSNNCDRMFYLALMNENLRRKAKENEDVAVAYHAAFGLTPRILPDFEKKPGYAVYNTKIGRNERRHRENPLGFIAVMAKSTMVALQWNIDDQESAAKELFENRLCPVHRESKKAKRRNLTA